MKSNPSANENDLLDFISKCPTPWHTVSLSSKLLSKEGFKELKEEESWQGIRKEKKFFIARDGSSLAGFILPKGEIKSLKIALAHTDSPGLKLKPHPEIQSGGLYLLSSEVYGSPLLTSWLNRDLCLAGRVFVEAKGGRIESHLLHLEEHPLVIPQLAIHLDRESKEKGLSLNPQNHLLAIASLLHESHESSFMKVIESKVKAPILSFDLFLVPLERPRLAGLNKEFISAPRFDNLGSVQAILESFKKESQDSNGVLKAFFFWNHEEVGSLSSEGAESTFFQDTLERIAESIGLTKSQLLQIYRNSYALSVDQAHATHPAFPERYELQHPVRLGEGIVLKNNSQKKYATNAFTSAIAKTLLKNEHLPFQDFVMRNDMPCGSTVGSIFAAKSGIATLDIGCPMLSMHSIRELGCMKDQLTLISFMKAFFSKQLPIVSSK